MAKISPIHEDLIKAASDIIKDHYLKHWHSIGAALLTRDGKIFTAFNIDATVGRIAVCAEPIAIAMALKEHIDDLDTIVAVRHPDIERHHSKYEIVPPCGMCREIAIDYDSDIHVIINIDGTPARIPMKDLLPYKYER
jgi:cytidine deaminase